MHLWDAAQMERSGAAACWECRMFNKIRRRCELEQDKHRERERARARARANMFYG